LVVRPVCRRRNVLKFVLLYPVFRNSIYFMKIIPVIDLKDGIVVHAKQGQREHYQPINSRLCESSDVYRVINAFLGIYDFDTFYIADLNAITGQGDHKQLISDVLSAFPKIIFWVDSGYQLYDKVAGQPGNYLPVLGSESYSDETVFELGSFNNNFILSLDYSAAEELGAKSLFYNQDWWPDIVIIMTLNCVGSNCGPDLNRLSQFYRQYPGKKFVAAGGVRNGADLAALKQVGIELALVASALHSGAVTREDILKYCSSEIESTL